MVIGDSNLTSGNSPDVNLRHLGLSQGLWQDGRFLRWLIFQIPYENVQYMYLLRQIIIIWEGTTSQLDVPLSLMPPWTSLKWNKRPGPLTREEVFINLEHSGIWSVLSS